MPNFESLGFDQTPIPVSFEDMPDQFVRLPIPQPGQGFILRVPPISLGDDIWGADLDDKGNRRLVCYFGANKDGVGVGKELLIVHDPHGELAGQLFRWRVSNAESDRGRDGTVVLASRMAYLIRDGLRGADLTNQPNGAYAEELVRHAGRVFSANVSWNARCNDQAEIYKYNEAGVSERVSGQKGCGQRYGLRKYKNRRSGELTILIPKEDQTGRYAEEFLCATEGCGAVIRCFADLDNFGPAEEAAQGEG